MPHLKHERLCLGPVVGVDEAGRGPLAGPVVAAAVVFPRGVPDWVRPLLDDSKKLTAAAREEAAAALLGCGAAVAVGAASVAEIARLNILHASMLAMRRAVGRLAVVPDLVLVDGDRVPPGLPCPAVACVGGDGLSLSIAAASIVAKVVRDRAMLRLHLRHPQYGWAGNAGYGTAAHRAALRRHGVTPHHRAGFGTVRAVLAQGALVFSPGAD